MMPELPKLKVYPADYRCEECSSVEARMEGRCYACYGTGVIPIPWWELIGVVPEQRFAYYEGPI